MTKKKSNKDFDREIIFLPGGPWLDGRYLDSYIKKNLNSKNVSRLVYPNHEFKYGQFPDLSFEEMTNLVSKSHKKVSPSAIIVGHSYGGLIILNILRRKLINLNLENLVLVSTPFSGSRSRVFQSKFNKIVRPSFITDIDFSNFLQKILSFYFYKREKLNPKDFGKSYYVFNKSANLTREEYKAVYDVYLSIRKKINVIVGSEDIILRKSERQSIKSTRFHLVRRCGHFAMLENSEKFTAILEGILKQS